jgi:hypothetical protein
MIAGWMNQIWPQIWSMLFNDAYFRVFEHAREITGQFNGTFTAVIHDGYLTFQMVAIRRLCDGRTDVISLRRALLEARERLPAMSSRVDDLLSRVESRCDRVRTQVNQHIAHTANPGRTPNAVVWNMQMRNLTRAHEAICKAATILDRDILQRQTFTNIVPVPQGDIMQDFRIWVPDEGIQTLYRFWHDHVKRVDDWGRHPHGWSEETP